MIRLWLARLGLLLGLVALPLWAQAQDITTNLESWHRLEEATGVTAVDSVAGNVHPATPSASAPASVTGQVGNGMAFTRANSQRFIIADHNNYTFNTAGADTPFSLAMWVKLNDVSLTQGIIAKYINSAPEWVLYTTANLMIFQLYQNGSNLIGRQFPITSGTHQGVWLCLVATYSGSETATGLKIYVNSARADTVDSNGGTYTGMVNTTTGVEVGAFDGAQNFLSGSLDEIRIFRRELTATDVSSYCAYPSTPAGGVVRRRPLVY